MKLFKLPVVASDVFVTVGGQTKYIIGDLDSFTEITAAESAADTVEIKCGVGTITVTTDGADDTEKQANAIKFCAYLSDRIASFAGDGYVHASGVVDLIPSISHMTGNAGLEVTGAENNTAIKTIAITA